MPQPQQSSSRVAFLDWARALAMLVMIQDHTFDALLSQTYLHGPFYSVWLFIRGLTAPVFFILSGVSFSIAVFRRWDANLSPLAGLAKRLRRYVVFILLGYAMHIPARSLHALKFVDAEGWHRFLQVDVLQLVGLTLIFLQMLTLFARTPRRFATCCAAIATAVILVAPMMWTVEWSHHVPLSIAGYLSGGTGSQFPIFPWSGYLLFGCAIGYLYLKVRSSAAGMRVIQVGAGLGLLLVACGVALSKVPLELYSYPQSWAPSPNLFLVRLGCVCLLLCAVAYTTRKMTVHQTIAHAFARESLAVYFVHICVVYGSPWNVGLRQTIGPRLTLLSCAAVVVILVFAMAVMAPAWSWTTRAVTKVLSMARARRPHWMLNSPTVAVVARETPPSSSSADHHRPR